jgi:hypothetical protein
MIAVRDQPGILSQTQRRRRYPKRQQRHCYDCFQPVHGKQKYSAPLEIFKQFLKAINAPVRSSAEFPNLYHARARAILTSCRSSTGRKFFGELTVELSILHPHDHHDQQNNQQNANNVPDPTSPTLDTSS